jgi:small nuclear ribonucleoprotein D3
VKDTKTQFLFLFLDMLKNAPMFKNLKGGKAGTAGRGKSAILRAQGKFS